MAICSSPNSTKREDKNNFCCFWKLSIPSVLLTNVFLHRLPMNRANSRWDSSWRGSHCFMSTKAQHEFTYPVSCASLTKSQGKALYS